MNLLQNVKKNISRSWECVSALIGDDRIRIPTVRIEGVIGQSLRRKGVSEKKLRSALDKAFNRENVKAVALLINSPGGSPAQSSLIYKRIKRLKAEKNISVFAFVEDVAASGGYYIAAAADEIYADENSIVGSIGVVSAGFGLQDAIRKIGVERRVYSSGKNKVALDPFQAENSEDVERLKSVQKEIHENFKKVVRSSRGSRLKAAEDEVFEGEFFAGATALEKGLIDGIGSVDEILRQKFGEKAEPLFIETDKLGFWERKLGIEHSVSSAVAAGLQEGVRASAQEVLSEQSRFYFR